MSTVLEIEAAIEKLSPLEKQEVAAWVTTHCPPSSARRRPRLKDAVFTPVRYAPDAFATMTEAEIKSFGLS